MANNTTQEQSKPWYKKPMYWVAIIIGIVLFFAGVGVFVYSQLSPSRKISLAQSVYDWASMQGSITPQTLKQCAAVSGLDSTGINQLKQMALGKDGTYAVHNLCRNTAVQRLHNAGIYPELKRPMPTFYVP